ncbi:cation diffusion facilitator 1 [Ophiocordyceps camponoti-floridani]|uniref:Cation diffusion facilitator 1 n=1 Tax=Ophiocordyceps camponoti-floridani TaxID=2030778 RepID=A0A8H4Q748_9HYPO|nr:cation diffusion facilitator 1 [Ophiocordyceps camponoti-floridani]
MIYCFFYRRFPSVHVFFVDHRNDIVVNVFGLVMSIVGDRFVWYLDPVGAICIALLILVSWSANAFEQAGLLAGRSAPTAYISKLIYVSLTHSSHILKVDTCRAYHAGQNYYVEIDVVMDAETPLLVSHDVGQSLQRKLEGLADVERAFVHIDYEHEHDIYEEHKPLYDKTEPKSFREQIRSCLSN